MARQVLTKSTVTNPWPTVGVALTETVEDVANGSSFPWTGREIIVIHNTHATTTYTWTLAGVTYLGRVGPITTENIVAGAITLVGPLSDLGFKQTDGSIYLNASNASVKFGIITF